MNFIFWMGIIFLVLIVITIFVAWGTFLWETQRAWRQSLRLYAIHLRRRGKDYKRLNLWNRECFLIFREELFSSYEYTTISIWKLPHNPSKPIRRMYYYYKGD